ncbi:RNA polymerase sigma factor [Hamadaea tsunoensis]|uniref:RNA polymerase sigma factor n=1 Tax=Hamadaea tsunoensis TaxID=53368 RepID=UPI00040B020C|nr:sigma-70 family RNA polymerase sigma factor [Hamadaea tsunoensis]
MGPPHDEQWFTGTYERHYPQVVRYVLRRTADADLAAELAQDTFAVAWRRRRDVPEHCLPWLYAVARRLLANHWRAGRSGERAMAEVDAGYWDGDADAVAGVADLRTALGALSEADQEILRLVGWEELTVAEAAQVLGCTRTTAAVRLHRARKRLLASLDRPRERVETR